MSLFEFNEVNVSACRPSSELHEIRGSGEGLRAERLTSLNSNEDILQYIETNSIRGHCSIQRQ